MTTSKWPAVLIGAVAFIALTPQHAYAYLDPGTASLVLQGIVGAVGAGFVVMGMYWRRFLGLFRKQQPDDDRPKQKGGAVED